MGGGFKMSTLFTVTISIEDKDSKLKKLPHVRFNYSGAKYVGMGVKKGILWVK